MARIFAICDNYVWNFVPNQFPFECNSLDEQKVDIRVIQILLGHKKLETTALYAQVATGLLREVISPLERLHPA
jgi:site-specific recombinase XerC